MQFGEAYGELLPHGEHHFGQQRRPIGVEEPIERAANAVIAKLPHLRHGEPKQLRREAHRSLLLAVNRFALDDDRSQQHSQCLRMCHRAAPIARGHVLVEQRLQADALEEMVDQG